MEGVGIATVGAQKALRPYGRTPVPQALSLRRSNLGRDRFCRKRLTRPYKINNNVAPTPFKNKKGALGKSPTRLVKRIYENYTDEENLAQTCLASANPGSVKARRPLNV